MKAHHISCWIEATDITCVGDDNAQRHAPNLDLVLRLFHFSNQENQWVGNRMPLVEVHWNLKTLEKFEDRHSYLTFMKGESTSRVLWCILPLPAISYRLVKSSHLLGSDPEEESRKVLSSVTSWRWPFCPWCSCDTYPHKIWQNDSRKTSINHRFPHLTPNAFHLSFLKSWLLQLAHTCQNDGQFLIVFHQKTKMRMQIMCSSAKGKLRHDIPWWIQFLHGIVRDKHCWMLQGVVTCSSQRLQSTDCKTLVCLHNCSASTILPEISGRYESNTCNMFLFWVRWTILPFWQNRTEQEKASSSACGGYVKAITFYLTKKSWSDERSAHDPTRCFAASLLLKLRTVTCIFKSFPFSSYILWLQDLMTIRDQCCWLISLRFSIRCRQSRSPNSSAEKAAPNKCCVCGDY